MILLGNVTIFGDIMVHVCHEIKSHFHIIKITGQNFVNFLKKFDSLVEKYKNGKNRSLNNLYQFLCISNFSSNQSGFVQMMLYREVEQTKSVKLINLDLDL